MATRTPKEYLRVTDGQIYNVGQQDDKEFLQKLDPLALLDKYSSYALDTGQSKDSGLAFLGGYQKQGEGPQERQARAAYEASLRSDPNRQAELLTKYGLNTPEGLQKFSQSYASFYNKSNSPEGLAAQEAQIAKQNAGTAGTPENPLIPGAVPQPGTTQPPAPAPGVAPVDQTKIDALKALNPNLTPEQLTQFAQAFSPQGTQGATTGATGTTAPQPKTYTVQAGDTLSKIARQMGVKISDISGYRSGNPNLIFPGENLTVGQQPPVGTQGTEGTAVAGVAEQAEPVPGVEPLSPTEQEYKAHLENKTYTDFVTDFGKQVGLDNIKTQVMDFTKQLEGLRNKKAGEATEINNNPWISEELRMKKLANLEGKYQQQEANLLDTIGLAQKQFDDAQEDIKFAAKFAIESMDRDRQFELETKKFAASLQGGGAKPTSDIQEYEYAQSQGYDGSFLDYQRQAANLKAKAAGGGDEVDVGNVLAYAQQYASTGKIPTGIPKGSFGVISEAAKSLPKQEGQLYDINTGVFPEKLSATQVDGVTALYDLNKKLNDLDALYRQVNTGLIGGTFGGIVPSANRVAYNTLRSEITDLLARARTGAAITAFEEASYAKKLPGTFNQTFFLGASGSQKIGSLQSSLSGKLDSTLQINGVDIQGYLTKAEKDELAKLEKLAQ